jgi:hypothetical protein
MKKWWKKKTHHNGEAGLSTGGRLHGPGHVVNVGLPPRLEDFIGHEPACNSGEHVRWYFHTRECRRCWRNKEGITHPNATLPSGWHLNIK